MGKRIILVALLVGVLTAGAAAGPILDPAHIREKTLDNGLRVVVKSERQWPVAALGLVIRAGSGYETVNNCGVAHMVEHLLFEERRSKEGLGPWVENMGGYISGMVTRDFTQVTVATSSGQLNQMLPKLAESVFAAQFTPEAVAHQQHIILREMADRLSSTSEVITFFTWELAYAQHPYGRPIPGRPDQVEELDVHKVRAFYNQFYRPDNVALIAVGDVDADRFFAEAEQAFGGYRNPEAALPEVPPEPAQTEVRTRIEQMGKSITMLQFAWHAPGIANKREVCATDLIYMIMDDELNQMAQSPEGDKKLLAGAVVGFLTQRWPGLFIISAVTEPAQELDLRRAVLAKIDELRTTPVSAEVLEATKQRLYAQYAFSNEAYTDQVESMCFYEAIDSYQFAVDYIDLINQITAEDVQKTAAKYLGVGNYNLVILRPPSPSEAQREVWLR